MNVERVACATSAWLASPFAIAVVPIATVVAVWVFGPEIPLIAISILALTFSQLVLLSSAIETRAIQAKLDTLVIAVPEASNEVAGLEKKQGGQVSE